MMIKEVIQVVAGKYEPIVKTSIQVKEENKHLKQRIKNMSTENVQLKKNNQQMLADLRKILTTGKFFPGMMETYIADILKQQQQAAQKDDTSHNQRRGIKR